MASIVTTYDLPPQEQMEVYYEKVKGWISTILKQPGLKEFRAYRNPFRTTPQVMSLTEFDSLESCLKYVKSEVYDTMASELGALGVTNASVQLWDTSPAIPEPLKPSSG
jgi:heme-degrading monooxygenase HmoA